MQLIILSKKKKKLKLFYDMPLTLYGRGIQNLIAANLLCYQKAAQILIFLISKKSKPWVRLALFCVRL